MCGFDSHRGHSDVPQPTDILVLFRLPQHRGADPGRQVQVRLGSPLLQPSLFVLGQPHPHAGFLASVLGLPPLHGACCSHNGPTSQVEYFPLTGSPSVATLGIQRRGKHGSPNADLHGRRGRRTRDARAADRPTWWHPGARAAVRVALRALRFQFGTWERLSAALRYKADRAKKVSCGRDAVVPAMAFRVARLVDVGIDDLLAGRCQFPVACPTCGHVAGPREATDAH